MKRTPLALAALAIAAVLTLALLPTQETVSADDHKKADSHKILEESMEVLAGNYRTIRRQSRDASKNADTADKIAEMIAASVKAKTAIPETATNAELKSNYRVIMNKLIVVLAEAENAALAGDQEKLGKLVRDMNTVKGEGHEMFIADE